MDYGVRYIKALKEKTVLLANYGEEIQQNHRAIEVIADDQSRSLDDKMNNII